VGVAADNVGFSSVIDGQWAGLDIDLGRALAAALFGDPEAVEFVIQDDETRFSNVANGIVDVSAHMTTQSLVSDASLGVDFSSTYFYSGQGILVRQDSGIDSLQTLSGLRIGFVESTTSWQNLEDAFANFATGFVPVQFETADELFAVFEQGDIDAVSGDVSLLASRVGSGADLRILPVAISKEPLALVVDENQSEFLDVVNAVVNVLLQAEQLGIHSGNIQQLLASDGDDLSVPTRIFLGTQLRIGENLGLHNDFAVQVIQAVGNYQHIYARHFADSVLPRDNNLLSSD
jgi:ABC-type amino acid transport substrate-binding protein